MDVCDQCPHWVGRHDPDDGSCDSCVCVNRSLIEVLDEPIRQVYDSDGDPTIWIDR